MPITKEERISRKHQHTKQERIGVLDGVPSSDEVREGVPVLRDTNEGLVEYVKHKGVIHATPKGASSSTVTTSATSAVRGSGVDGAPPLGGFSGDHGDLTGLTDDDHTQYLNTTRHTAIGDSSPHHEAVTAGDGINLTGQQVSIVYEADAPSTINAGDTAVVGVANETSRGDHQHAVSTASAENVDLTASDEGASTSLARADHHHALSQSIAPTWTGLHKFDEKIEVNRGGSSYITDYAINSEPESNGRHLASGKSDGFQNYSWIGLDDDMSSSINYDTSFGSWS